MKALVLRQPWASMVAQGAKRIETRSWRTHYRGPLAILSGKKLGTSTLIEVASCLNDCGALGHPMGGGLDKLQEALPLGVVVAVCDLVDCRRTGDFKLAEIEQPQTRRDMAGFNSYRWTERELGNFALTRWGWVLANVRPLAVPLPWRGRQGLFDIALPEGWGRNVKTPDAGGRGPC